MSAIVIGTPQATSRGRKPGTRAGFRFGFRNDAAGGTTVVDVWGNAGSLSLAGTLSTAWTASRGFWRPNGTDAHALTAAGAAQEYAAQSVVDVATPGGIIIGWRWGWNGAKPTSNETVLCVGRGAASGTPNALAQVGFNNAGLLQFGLRGVGASALTTNTFGSAGDYSATADQTALMHLEVTAAGINVSAWLNGVAIGSQRDFVWSANSGTAPALANFLMPDGITIGAQRGGTNPASPTFAQRWGSGTSAGSRLAEVYAVNLGEVNLGTAADVALEVHQNPRWTGEILKGL